MERERALLLLERHQPAPLWRLLRLRRCPSCRSRWPCARYSDARSALLSHDRNDVAALVRLNTALVRRNSRWPQR